MQYWLQASQVAVVVKNWPAKAGVVRDTSLIPGLGRSPGGHGNPLQYSFLENPMDRGAWWDTVHRMAQSQTGLKQLSTHACTDLIIILYEILCIHLTLTLRQSYSLKNHKIYNIHIKWRGSTEQQKLMSFQRDWKLVVIRVLSLRGVSGLTWPDLVKT